MIRWEHNFVSCSAKKDSFCGGIALLGWVFFIFWWVNPTPVMFRALSVAASRSVKLRSSCSWLKEMILLQQTRNNLVGESWARSPSQRWHHRVFFHYHHRAISSESEKEEMLLPTQIKKILQWIKLVPIIFFFIWVNFKETVVLGELRIHWWVFKGNFASFKTGSVVFNTGQLLSHARPVNHCQGQG